MTMLRAHRWFPLLALTVTTFSCSGPDDIGAGGGGTAGGNLGGTGGSGAAGGAGGSGGIVGPGGTGGQGGHDNHGGAGGQGGEGGHIASTGLTSRPSNTTCLAFPRPTTEGELELQPAFDNGVSLTGITDMKRAPAAFPGWLAIEQTGKVYAIPDGAAAAQTLLQASDFPALQTGGELGFLGLAVDPLYPSASDPNTVRVYINYTAWCNGASAPLCTFVSRFTLTATGSGAATTFAVVDDEEVLMKVRQPRNNHNGGGMGFGPDGYLYVSFGDGGDGDDKWCNSQNLATPLGKILRLDVHSTATGYAIPPDNPFRADGQGSPRDQCNEFLSTDNPSPGYPSHGYIDVSRTEPCPEIVAFGLRNPFRFSFDRHNPYLWIGDVGQDAVEEVNFFDITDLHQDINFGWPLREGNANHSQSTCDDLLSAPQGRRDAYLAPKFIYRHADNPSRGVVTGGFVYRGNALGDAYRGSYFFAEAQTGELWAISNPYTAAREIDVHDAHESLTVAAVGFAEDDEGELYVLTSPVQRIVMSEQTVTLPGNLRDTGCVDPDDPRQPASGLIPYDLIAPLWSDGADKHRFIALPDGEHITRAGNCGSLTPQECEEQQDWEFPVGTVLVKMFERDGKMLETRLFMRHDDGGWAGYTYVWNAAGTEATLAGTGQTYLPDRDWTAPSRQQCMRCHTSAAGFSLGLETAQLNRTFTYPSTGLTANQIATFNAIGLFDDPVTGEVSALPRLASPTGPDVEGAARAYLSANCSNCHRPGGNPSPINLHWRVSFADMNLCDQLPLSDWGDDVMLFSPGEPAKSLISIRPLAPSSPQRMPPLGTVVVDPILETNDPQVGVINAWINSVSACPP